MYLTRRATWLCVCVWDRTGLSEAAQGFNLIPVSGVGEVVGGVSEAVGEQKIGGNAFEGMFSKDMTDDK